MDIAALRREADRLHRLAWTINDAAMAAELERLAREIEERIAAPMRIDPEEPAGTC